MNACSYNSKTFTINYDINYEILLFNFRCEHNLIRTEVFLEGNSFITG